MKLLVVLSMASFNEVLAYALRIPGSNSNPTGAVAPLSPLLFFITPLMVTSVIFIVFYKMALRIAPYYTIIKLPLVVKLWGAGDIICQLLVSTGAMLASRAENQGQRSAGKAILLAVLGIHTVTLAAFTMIVVHWQHRSSRLIEAANSSRLDFWALYCACGMIILRGILRFGEIASGPDGPIQKHEVAFYFFDFIPVLIALTACLQFYGNDTLKASPGGTVET
ncbi:hypothetical protein BS50DRAFT_620656 [Corynespora cassiicola Philippines]|uniref:RTA1 like protein n=1 Tax=Corynespora cassiicola Philippines TaxID=1448308 RepID=A0A2T2NSC1_CORCC|nr:hypothetical protein BS50DRAFT_620656 [Corynespora cassiicola Philippines]